MRARSVTNPFYRWSCAALVAGMALWVSAPVAAQTRTAWVSQDTPLQAGPDDDYPQVGMLFAGSSVALFGCLQDTAWCDVSQGGERGWVDADDLETVYNRERVVIGDYSTLLALPWVTFAFDDYWGRYYRYRPWYHDRHRWSAWDWRGHGHRWRGHDGPDRPHWGDRDRNRWDHDRRQRDGDRRDWDQNDRNRNDAGRDRRDPERWNRSGEHRGPQRLENGNGSVPRGMGNTERGDTTRVRTETRLPQGAARGNERLEQAPPPPGRPSDERHGGANGMNDVRIQRPPRNPAAERAPSPSGAIPGRGGRPPDSTRTEGRGGERRERER